MVRVKQKFQNRNFNYIANIAKPKSGCADSYLPKILRLEPDFSHMIFEIFHIIPPKKDSKTHFLHWLIENEPNFKCSNFTYYGHSKECHKVSTCDIIQEVTFVVGNGKLNNVLTARILRLYLGPNHV